MFYSKKFKKFDKIKHCFFKKRWILKGLYKGLNCGRGSNDNTGCTKKFRICITKMRVKKKI